VIGEPPPHYAKWLLVCRRCSYVYIDVRLASARTVERIFFFNIQH
jgi:hypothetical protein